MSIVYNVDYCSDVFLVMACDGIWDVMTNDGMSVFLSDYFKLKGMHVYGLCYFYYH